MSALQPLPTPILSNTTVTLPVSWGESWVPTEAPVPPLPRRKRRGGPLWREDGVKGDGEEKRVNLNASLIAEFLNLTAEDVDYMFNITIGGAAGEFPWKEKNRETAVQYILNSRKSRHNASVVQRQKNKSGRKSNEPCYCGSSESLFRRMLLAYRPLHPVAALTVCVLGTLANALNVAVLTRPHLAPAPVNRILTAIAAADAALMAEYAVFAFIILIPHWKVKVENSPKLPPMTPAEEAARAERDYPFAAAAFVLFHMHFSQVLHTVSICLTLTLAVWRLLALRLPPERARTLCSRRRCSVALAVSLLLPPLLCSPVYLVFGITTTKVTMGGHHPPPVPPEDFSVTPLEYTLDPGFLLPTAAVSLDEKIEELSTHSPSPEVTTERMGWSSSPRGEGETPTPWTPFSEPPVSHPPPAVAVLYHLDLSDVAKDQEMLYISIFWVYAVMLKLIPCFVLTVISVWLVRTLCRAKSRRRTLLTQGEVKKAPQTTAPSQSRWRKSDDKVALSIANRSITPPAVQKPKPLDDGGVWMGREEEKVGDATEEEDQKPEEPPSAEEEEVATLVRVDKPPESVRESAPSGSGCWLWRQVKRRRERYSTEGGEISAQQQNTTAVVGAAVRRRRRRTERTTRMLVAVLVLFLVTEFPQGVLGLMSGLFGRCFFRYCYHIFGDLMDLLALLNGSINFILYCAMSRQFRQTFAQLFCKHPRLLWTYCFKSYPAGQNKDIDIMKNGNMGEGHKKVGAATVGQTSQTMGEVQSTYV